MKLYAFQFLLSVLAPVFAMDVSTELACSESMAEGRAAADPDYEIVTECGAFPLDKSGLYTFSNHVICPKDFAENAAIHITANDVTLDCRGYALAGQVCSSPTSNGIIVSGKNVVIKNCPISCFRSAVKTSDSFDNVFLKNIKAFYNDRGVEASSGPVTSTLAVMDSVLYKNRINLRLGGVTAIVMDTNATEATVLETPEPIGGDGVRLLDKNGHYLLSGVNLSGNDNFGMRITEVVTDTSGVRNTAWREVHMHNVMSCTNGKGDIGAPIGGSGSFLTLESSGVMCTNTMGPVTTECQCPV